MRTATVYFLIATIYIYIGRSRIYITCSPFHPNYLSAESRESKIERAILITCALAL